MSSNTREKEKKNKSFWDYQNDPNYAQDVTTGEFVNIKTGKRVRFELKLK